MKKLDKASAKERIEKLRELINDYRHHYHVLDESTMSEAVADSLKHELSELESQFPELITADSPTQRIAGGIAKGFTKIKHSKRMLSLNDVFDKSEIEAWVKRIQKLQPEVKFKFFSDIKLDGLACALVYKDGVLEKAITRGDGFVGEDVTSNVKTIQSVPLKLKSGEEGIVEVRGEIVLFKADFDKLNAKLEAAGEKVYANPRNLAAGTIRQLDSSLVAKRPLQFFAYDLMEGEYAEGKNTHLGVYKRLTELGFRTSAIWKVFEDIDSLEENIANWETKRKELKFNSDGFVIKIDDRRAYQSLGIVGKAPRGAVAFKYPAEQSTTKLKDIFISIGRTGAATPVAILEPVNLDGSTVSMATLHNAREIERKDIRVGDTVIVEKAGDIIPAVVEPLIELRTGEEVKYKFPDDCPECSTKLIKLKLEDAVWRCPNNSCPARISRKIQHFAARGAMDIEGMGEKNIEALLNARLITDQADIFKLKQAELEELERFAELSAKNLVEAIAEKKEPELAKFIFALGIRQVGAQTAIDLANNFGSLEKLSEANLENLTEIDGVGEVVAESILAWFGDQENQEMLLKFKEFGVQPKEVKLNSGDGIGSIAGKLSGKSFVITGSLSLSGMSREEAADKIRALGGVFQSSVGKGTTYLIAGGKVGESKLKKAEKFGTEVIDEKELLDLINQV